MDQTISVVNNVIHWNWLDINQQFSALFSYNNICLSMILISGTVFGFGCLHFSADRAKMVSVYTTTITGDTQVPGSPQWSLCRYNAPPLGIIDYIQCDRRNPLIRQVSLQVGYNKGVQLRELEVYGLGNCYWLLSAEFFCYAFSWRSFCCRIELDILQILGSIPSDWDMKYDTELKKAILEIVVLSL